MSSSNNTAPAHPYAVPLAQGALAQGTLFQQQPFQGALPQGALFQQQPVQVAYAQGAPLQQQPVQGGPAQLAPFQQQQPVQAAPAQAAPFQQQPGPQPGQTALQYLQAYSRTYMQSPRGLPRFYHNILFHDPVSLNNTIGLQLQNARAVRHLRFDARGQMAVPMANFKTGGKWEANLQSLFCYITGRLGDVDCSCCRNKRTYPLCVKFDMQNGGTAIQVGSRLSVCACCIYQENGTRCTNAG